MLIVHCGAMLSCISHVCKDILFNPICAIVMALQGASSKKMLELMANGRSFAAVRYNRYDVIHWFLL